ncbi:MAG: hypothetical protein IT381_14570 [Deltaproteobacteria bacterium]|nr:hypothetical protein [Deltaproteobacteria bacterium]
MSDVNALTNATCSLCSRNHERNHGATYLHPQIRVKVAGKNTQKANEYRPSTHHPYAALALETPPSQRQEKIVMVGSPTGVVVEVQRREKSFRKIEISIEGAGRLGREEVEIDSSSKKKTKEGNGSRDGKKIGGASESMVRAC